MITPSDVLRRAAREDADTGRAPRHGSAPRVPFALLVLGLVVGGLVLLLALNTASAANELQRQHLVERDSTVAAQVQDLKVRVAASGAPANLAAAAAALGMVPAGNPAFVVIGPDGRAKVMGSPEAATAAPVVVPKPKGSTSPSATASRPPSATTSPTGRATPSRSGTRSGTRSSSPSRSAARPTPTPTPTPTPVVTLPGGTR